MSDVMHHNTLQQHYIARHVLYLQKVHTLREQIVLIFDIKPNLSIDDYQKINYALMQMLAYCGLLYDKCDLFGETVALQSPTKDELVGLLQRAEDVLKKRCTTLLQASNAISSCAKKRGPKSSNSVV